MLTSHDRARLKREQRQLEAKLEEIAGRLYRDERSRGMWVEEERQQRLRRASSGIGKRPQAFIASGKSDPAPLPAPAPRRSTGSTVNEMVGRPY